METLFLILLPGLIVNLVMMIKVYSLKYNPQLQEDLHSGNAYDQISAHEKLADIKGAFITRLFGFFLGYGAIWGWIDIIKYFIALSKTKKSS